MSGTSCQLNSPAESATTACIPETLLPAKITSHNGQVNYHWSMVGTIAGRTASEMPGLDIAEQRSWQNFLDAALRMHATLNRSLVATHHLTLNDVRLLDILDRSEAGSARMGDLAEGLM